MDVPETSSSSTGEPSFYNEHGDPVYANMVSVCNNKCKYLIQFPISTELEKVRNSVESSKCSTILLKADTTVDVNLMNSKTFDSMFNRKHLQFTSLRMEAYGNHSAVEVLGKFHAFLRWKGKVYRQLFYVTYANNSWNLLSSDGCYTLREIKSCYSEETGSSSSKFQGIPQVIPTQPSSSLEKLKMQGECDPHCRNEGNDMETSNCSRKPSIMKDELQGAQFTKAKILYVYSDIFTRTGKFPGEPYKFQLKEMQNQCSMLQGRFQFIYTMLSMRKSEIWNNLDSLSQSKKLLNGWVVLW